MQTEIKKWGNSAVVRLPVAMLAEVKLAVGSPVNLKTDDGRLVIEPCVQIEYKLDDLLAGITTDNRHESVDWGMPTGREATV